VLGFGSDDIFKASPVVRLGLAVMAAYAVAASVMQSK
jgi:hypothetical protein